MTGRTVNAVRSGVPTSGKAANEPRTVPITAPALSDPRYSQPFVMPACLRPEIEAALRQVLSDYRAGKVASFMVNENAKGDVLVMILEPDEP